MSARRERSVERHRRLNGGQQTLPYPLLAAEANAISATVKIGSESEIGNKLT